MGLDRSFRDQFLYFYAVSRRDLRTINNEMPKIFSIPHDQQDERFHYAKLADKKRVDHLCIDANSLIHKAFEANVQFMIQEEHEDADAGVPAAQRRRRRSKNNRRITENTTISVDEEFISGVSGDVIIQLKKLYQGYKPTVSFFIALDGPCALCKGKEQRLRRYFNVQSVHISPGTKLMHEVDRRIKEWIKSYFSNLKNNGEECVQDVVYSGSSVDGEGEMKILEYLINNGCHDSVVIHTPDSDMLSMILTLPQKNVWVVNNDFFVQKSDIVRKMMERLPSHDIGRIALDHVLLSMLFGNDYIGALESPSYEHTPKNLMLRYMDMKDEDFAKTQFIIEPEAEKVSLNLSMLRKLLQTKSVELNTEESNVARTRKYLQSLLWCLQSYRTGYCYDYEQVIEKTPNLQTLLSGIDIMLRNNENNVSIQLSRTKKPHPYIPAIFHLYIVPLNHAISVLPDVISDFVSSLQNDDIYAELLKCEPTVDIAAKLKLLQVELLKQIKYNTGDEWIADVCSNGRQLTYNVNNSKKAGDKRNVSFLTLINVNGLSIQEEVDEEIEQELIGMTVGKLKRRRDEVKQEEQLRRKQFITEQSWIKKQSATQRKETRALEKKLKSLNKKIQKKKDEEVAVKKQEKEIAKALRQKQLEERQAHEAEQRKKRKEEKELKKQQEEKEYMEARAKSQHPLLQKRTMATEMRKFKRSKISKPKKMRRMNNRRK